MAARILSLPFTRQIGAQNGLKIPKNKLDQVPKKKRLPGSLKGIVSKIIENDLEYMLREVDEYRESKTLR